MLRFIRNPIVWMVGGVFAALPAPALPVGETGRDIPITDSVLLQRLGFEPDATDVYAMPRALEELLMSPEERVAAQRARLEEYRNVREQPVVAAPFGTGSAGSSPIEARAIRPRRSETEYTLSGEVRVCLSGHSIFDAQFDSLPHGAKLERVDVWYLDLSDENLTAALVRVCHPDFESGGASTTILGSVASNGAAGSGFATIGPFDEDIDLESCAYLVQVILDGGFFDCSEGSDLGIQKVRAQWRRQISPPPVSPTFDDVDGEHPFFQHIEALVASGITGGCGDGSSFCPDDLLTRGQMAVFLAKTLGLHWTEIAQ
ncbi:MAG: S-layer homology domain-containing protein [Thermoanaerobaculia bacterium]